MLVRNFFEFLESEIDSTIYKNIYGPWGIAHKTEYIPICRKCPTCHTYINDQSASFCFYCGAEINQKQTYTKMFERLQRQQQFAKIPGFSHPTIPYKEVDRGNGEIAHRVKYCPTCLNSSFTEAAQYCSICGQPLYSFCKECNSPLDPWDCYCPQCGTESSINRYYKQAEERLMKIKDCSGHHAFSEDWLRYTYWGYVKMRLMGNRSSAPEELKSALLYSNAYLDDHDNVIVFTDTIQAAAAIYDNRQTVIDFMRKTDGIEYDNVEVYVADDLQ